jgi:Predicted integral membrane protein (DUF2269)
MYRAFKVIHLLGVVLFLGNIIVTAVWKMLADRTREPRTIAYAQRLVTVTDWIFYLGRYCSHPRRWVWDGCHCRTPSPGNLAHLGAKPVHHLRRHLGCDSHPDSASSGSDGTSLCSERANPGGLLAPWQSLGYVGSNRHVASLGQSLFHGFQTVSLIDGRPARSLIWVISSFVYVRREPEPDIELRRVNFAEVLGTDIRSLAIRVSLRGKSDR